MAKNDLGTHSNKKSRKLFRGMFAPLLVITFGAGAFFYYVTNQILKSYMKSQLELSVEKLSSAVVESMEPIINVYLRHSCIRSLRKCLFADTLQA